MPGGHGVRLDTHVYSGYTIPPNYDSMIVKFTTAQSRAEAISKMRRALDEFVIEGIKTTIPFHRQLMDDPRYTGDYTTAFMDILRWMTYKVLYFFTSKLAVKRVF
jgi:acetyl-CoA carboxylase biotin carboxylase subunit